MSSTNEKAQEVEKAEKVEKAEIATNLSNPPKPQKSNPTMSAPYPSPPNSPTRARAPTPRATTVSEERARSAGAVSSAPLSPPATPPRQLPASTSHEQLTEGNVKAETLRTRLGLGNRRCGAVAKSGKPCGSWSPAANRVGVTSQLESMINLTRSSRDLGSALDKLAKLVHCRNHDSGHPKESRIEAWIMEFPAGEASTTNPAASAEKLIRKTLRLVSPQCISVDGITDLRCPDGIGGQRVKNCAVTVDEIVNPDVCLDDGYLDGLLKVLETNMYCPKHINAPPLKMVASWKSSIVEIREGLLVKSAESSAPRQTRGSSKAPNTQESENPSTKRIDGLVLRSGSQSIPNFDGDLSKYWPAAYDTSPFEIVQSARLADYESSYPIIHRELMRDFGEKDHKDGHIYLYEVEGNKGFVKIGYTARPVEKRHGEWDFDCNRVSTALYPIPSSTVAKVPNARRVESLCHAELDHCRIRIDCKACLKQHLEWFEISSAEAIAVIQKWSNWMATCPYKSIQLRSGRKWTIGEEQRRRARDMDRFMREM